MISIFYVLFSLTALESWLLSEPWRYRFFIYSINFIFSVISSSFSFFLRFSYCNARTYCLKSMISWLRELLNCVWHSSELEIFNWGMAFLSVTTGGRYFIICDFGLFLGGQFSTIMLLLSYGLFSRSAYSERSSQSLSERAGS